MKAQVLAAAAVVALLGSELPGETPALTSELIISGLSQPTWVAAPPGDQERLMIVQKGGRIRLAKDDVLQSGSFLDLSGLVPTETWNGMLGLCFDPDYANNGRFYVQHPLGGSSSNRVCVAQYEVSDNPDVADLTSRQIILEMDYPGAQAFHVGGWIGFGPDGYLYVPMGDGGFSGDATAGARSQSLNSAWGKVLRIDVHGEDAYPSDPDRNFAIPSDNPFIGQGLGEIWVRGLRNPYRADFDEVTGDFWIADVGLFMREEIDIVPAGSSGGHNFGWDCAEGTWCMTNGNCVCNALLTSPIHEYDHSDGCSITGGSVYDGCVMPEMQGRYFFSDWCTARIWSGRYQGGNFPPFVDLVEHTSELNPVGQLDISDVTAIGADGQGELIVVSQDGNLYRIQPLEGDDGCIVQGDVDGDGIVGVNDVLAVLKAWGNCAPDDECPADLDGDGLVGVDDILLLLANWTL
ncbi:MAG: PQQ-dependent sugar dehydrogenase [Planctomycetota bacterium]|nr:PQQ-dependent sugar dehydrogenase [Planctomycetota bacterium]